MSLILRHEGGELSALEGGELSALVLHSFINPLHPLNTMLNYLYTTRNGGCSFFRLNKSKSKI